MAEDKRYKVEGFWDCRYCGRKGIRGRFKSCPGCGHGRDASVRFYTMDISEASAITDEEFRRESAEADKNSHSESVSHDDAVRTSDGPSLYDRREGEGTGTEQDAVDASDWYCDYCDSYNPATTDVCRNCGAAREQSSGKTYEQTMGKVARTYDAQGNLVSERDLSQRSKPTAQVAAQPRKRGLPGCVMIALVALAAIVVLGILGSLLFGPKQKDLTVQGFDWEQTIAVEELQTVQEDGWTLPQDARLIRKSTEIRSYNHVVDHYETEQYEVPEQVLDHYDTYTTQVDNGDGTFDVEEHQEPVYRTEYRTETREVPVYVDIPIFDTKYYYELEKYVHTRDVTTSGNDHEPYWGEVRLSGATGEYGTGQEREGQRSGTYGVTDSEGTRYTADLDFWSSLEEGEEIKVVVDSNGHITPPE